MAVINDLINVKLQTKVRTEIMPSGATKPIFEDVENIKIALYDTNQMTVTQDVRYNQYDYAAISFYTKFDYHKRNMHRLIIGDDVYNVERVNLAGMMSYLLLKKVDVNG